MARLPDMRYGSRITQTVQLAFGGYRHSENCQGGEMFDMRNMSCADYPILSTRSQRCVITHGQRLLQGCYADNGVLITIADGVIYYGEIALAKTSVRAKHTLIRFGDRCVLMPDKAVLNTKYYILGTRQAAELLPAQASLYDAYAVGNNQTLEALRIFVFDGEKWVDNGLFKQPMEASVSVESSEESPSVTILDGTIYDESAKSNTMAVNGVEDFTKYFKVGDAVTITGCSVMKENNKTAVIREIEGHILRFSDYCFKMPLGEDQIPVREYDEIGQITIARMIPDMDGCFWHDNRLWGFKDSEIFASKLGDPANFNVFDGLSTDSWYLDTQLPGGFTAGISFGGYPIFLRERGITRIYGSKPAAYQTVDSDALGVKRGEEKSLTQAGGCLLYLSVDGFMRFDGNSLPISLKDVFGHTQYRDAVAGSDGKKAYIACRDETMQRHLFVYDTSVGVWMREDETEVLAFAYDGALFAAVKNAQGFHDVISMNGSTGNLRLQVQEEDAESFSSLVQFGDFTHDAFGRKAVSKILARIWVDDGATVSVSIRHDGGSWIKLQDITATGKTTRQICALPKRCDHYNIKFEGQGQWKLYGLAQEYYVGTAIK